MTFTGVRETLEIGRVISITASVIRDRFLALAVLSIAFSIPAVAVRVALLRTLPPYTILGNTIGSLVVYMLLWVVVTIAGAVLQGAVTPLVDNHLSGGRTTIRGAMVAAWRRVLPLAAVGLVFGLGVALGLFLLIVPGFFLATRWCVAAPALAAESDRVGQALGRSRALTEGSRWRILALIFAKYVLAAVITIIVQAARVGLAPMSLGAPISATLDLITLAAGAMVSTAGAAVLHTELRRIHDGLGATKVGDVFD